jgi:hypothetical protein
MLLASAIECHSAAYAEEAQAGEAPTNFVFVDGAAVTLSPDSSNAFKFDVPIKNSGKTGEAKATLLSGDEGCAEAKIDDPKDNIKLPTNGIAITPFKISGVKLPATCYIELVTVEADGKPSNTSLKQIKLTRQYVSSDVLVLLSLCLLASCITAAYAGFNITRELNVHRNFTLGSPAWDFAKSWFSTTTLVGAIISTALALSALPELTKYASKSGYSVLALLISLVVIVAPFIFVVFSKGEVKKDETGKKYSVEYEGPLWAFVVSCAITLFAGLAQLVVLCLLLHEVFQALWSLIAGGLLACYWA